MNAKSLIGGILAGTAVGVAIGMLFAPATGERTQKRLIKGARKLRDSLMEKADDSFESIKDKYNTQIDALAKRSKDGINAMTERVKV